MERMVSKFDKMLYKEYHSGWSNFRAIYLSEFG